MYKVLLVDDDVEMLEGLTGFIPWEEHGFSIAATAKNGFEALDLITKHMPDLLITDITMPLMDGLSLIRETKKFAPDMKTMLISCHEEFDYAREAIYLEADEYLIKHTLTEEVLISGIERIKAKLAEEDKQTRVTLHSVAALDSQQMEAQSKFFESVLYGDFASPDAMAQHAQAVNIALSPARYRAIAFFADDISEHFKRGIARQYGSFPAGVLGLILDNVENAQGITLFYLFRGDVFILLLREAEKPLKDDVIAFVKKCQITVEEAMGFRLSVCIGTQAFVFENFTAAMAELERLRDAYFYEESGRVIEKALNFPTEDTAPVYQKYASVMKNAVAMNDSEKLFQLSEEMLTENFRTYSPAALKTVLGRILIETALSVDTYDLSSESLQIKGDTFAEYRRSFMRVIQHMADNMRQQLPYVKHPEIKKALVYIHTNVSASISCEGTAAYVNMNPSYFSRLFKRETGDNFSDYLIKKRMQAATELLLHSSCTIEEISHLIGIESISYFYRVYKKNTGKTPGDVRSLTLPQSPPRGKR